MTTEKKVTNFAKTVLALIKGDDAEAMALHNERKANTSVDSQLAGLRSKLVDDESNLEDAMVALKTAKYPSTYKITNNNDYINSILRAQTAVDTMTEKLESTKASIKYFEDLKAEFAGL